MLTGKQKRFLRAQAHTLPAVCQIGKDGMHQNLLESVANALDTHELVKIRILETCQVSKNEVALDLSAATKAEVVQILGRTIVLYKPSDKKLYRLP